MLSLQAPSCKHGLALSLQAPSCEPCLAAALQFVLRHYVLQLHEVVFFQIFPSVEQWKKNDSDRCTDADMDDAEDDSLAVGMIDAGTT